MNLTIVIVEKRRQDRPHSETASGRVRLLPVVTWLTGTQLTIVDPSLATELHLETQGTAAVVGIGFKANAFLARVDSLEVGSRSIENHVVELQRLELPRSAGFQTGDLVSCDAGGLHWFVGRRKEIIVCGGGNISPQEVEAVPYQHPAVGEVRIVGRPDNVWGEAVDAFVLAIRPGSHGGRVDCIRAQTVGGLQDTGMHLTRQGDSHQ
jgi:acyl-CoA synthetase (AMP-forming)/AMP-acid ligase II